MKRLFSIFIMIFFLTSCGDEVGTSTTSPNINVSGAKETLEIVSGSENKELTPILEDFAEREKVNINMTYMGSIDIMRELQNPETRFDAVWPASSVWINMGDTEHRVKHTESISITPVVFGIKKSLAKDLGFVGKEVSIKELMETIEAGKLKFTMTSATQSNSGSSAYLGFLYGLSGNPDILLSEHLDDPKLQENIRSLLSGVERSSGSSEWLKTMFLNGDFDAMVNYESLIITTNEVLRKEGREELYVVYPYDGLSISDAPLGYIDKKNPSKEEAFLKLKDYLLSDEIQKEIQKYGRRTGFEGVDKENEKVFTATDGVVVDKILSPIPVPEPDVILKALNLYQQEFRKPPLTAYVLDFSGSMSGEGENQVKEAMAQILLEENAKKNFLQAQKGEMNYAILFSSDILATYNSSGDSQELEELYNSIYKFDAGGGTNMYNAAIEALDLFDEYDLETYSPAVILLTDGKSSGSFKRLQSKIEKMSSKVPIFTILFGSASEDQVSEIANYTNARVFDGRTDLIKAFRAAKGYN
ncbi:MAG: VWA domain-containing protein [Tissierellia bacterium]|nr:VWA domain-containing protein [Tissierellia bacterium]